MFPTNVSPLEILSGLGVPTLVAKMLIGTATGYGPKAQHFADVMETKLGTVAKEPWSSSKAQNIKEGIYIYN